MQRKKRFLLPLFMGLWLLLAACGDSPTPTLSPTNTVAPTTVAATATSAPATVAPTTAPPTTVAATTAATTARPTTGTGSGSTTALNLPSISNTALVNLEPAMLTEITKSLPTELSTATIKLYSSDDTSDIVANNTDTALVSSGYKFGIPGVPGGGGDKPTKQGDSYVGFYTKSGSPDILMTTADVPADVNDISKSLNIPGLSADAATKFASELKGKKTVLIFIAAPNLVAALTGTGASTTPAAMTPSTTTAAATRTVAPTTGSGSTSPLALPLISGTSLVNLEPAITNELVKSLPAELSTATIKLYSSDDAAELVAANSDTALVGSGYKFGIPGVPGGGGDKPTKQGDSYVGFYTKAGAPDILMTTANIPADAADISKSLNIPGLSADAAAKFASELKGKKTVLIFIAAPNLVSTLTGGGASTTPSATTTTAAATRTTAPTVAATRTTAPTTGSGSTSPLALPSINGATLVNLEPSITNELLKSLPAELSTATVKLYSSDDTSDIVAANTDTALVGSGYKFGIPGVPGGGGDKPTKQGEAYVGFYTKAGSPDILMTTANIPADVNDISKSLNIPGLSADAATKFASELKGKKTMLIFIASPNLVNALTGGGSSTTPSATTPSAATPAATTGATSGDTKGPGSELVGQILASGNTDIKVTKVERFTELKDGTKTITPKGVFMAITFDVANLGKEPEAFTFVNLVDGTGTKIETTSDFDAISTLISKYNYKSSVLINPGFVGLEYKVYDVAKDATGFKLQPDEFLGDAKGRTAAAASFTNSGGKGPDSGAGQELQGKTLSKAKDKVDISVTKVERLTQVKSGSTILKPNGGVYLIVSYDAKNNSDKTVNFTSFYIKDSDGRTFTTSTDFDVVIALATSGYKSFTSVDQGNTGQGYAVFEVLSESKGFELADNS